MKAEEFIKRARAFDISQNKDDYDDMMEALFIVEFYLPVKGLNFKNPNVKKENTTLEKNNIYSLYTEDGKEFIPIFTSLTELKRWNKKEVKSFKYNYDEIIQLIDRLSVLEGFTVNPYTDNLTFNKSLIKKCNNLRKGISMDDFKSKKITTIEPLDIRFTDFKDTICQLSKPFKHVSEIFASFKDDDGDQKILIYIVSEIETFDLEEKINELAKPINGGYEIIYLKDDDKDLIKTHRQDCRIYRKKKFMFF